MPERVELKRFRNHHVIATLQTRRTRTKPASFHEPIATARRSKFPGAISTSEIPNSIKHQRFLRNDQCLAWLGSDSDAREYLQF
jgi:hypothetical protein